jgi:hypothetical protein
MGHKRKKYLWRTRESTRRSWMILDPTRRWVKILEEDNGSGQEEEEEEDQQDPFQEDHVDVTNLLHLLNRIVTNKLL